MKHIAVRSKSLRKDAPYTVPGLGDRLHTVIMGYNYSILNNHYVVPLKTIIHIFKIPCQIKNAFVKLLTHIVA